MPARIREGPGEPPPLVTAAPLFPFGRNAALEGHRGVEEDLNRVRRGVAYADERDLLLDVTARHQTADPRIGVGLP